MKSHSNLLKPTLLSLIIIFCLVVCAPPPPVRHHRSRPPRPSEVIIPYLIGKELSEASRILLSNHLVLGRIVERPTDRRFDNDRVAAQSPSDGLRVREGAKVDLEVWRFRAPVAPKPILKVPDLTGMRVKRARTLLQQEGLVLVQIYRKPVPPAEHAGLVFRQKPDAGTAIRAGETVDIWVYKKSSGDDNEE